MFLFYTSIAIRLTCKKLKTKWMNFDPQTTLSWRPEFIADTAALKYSRTISERTRSWTLEIKNMVRPLSDSSEREHQSRRAWPLACRSKFLRWGRGTSIWKWRRCLPSCLGADDVFKKNLSNNDGDDYENVTQNGNLSVFKHYRAYSISFNSSNVANFFLELNSERLYGSSGKEK